MLGIPRTKTKGWTRKERWGARNVTISSYNIRIRQFKTVSSPIATVCSTRMNSRRSNNAFIVQLITTSLIAYVTYRNPSKRHKSPGYYPHWYKHNGNDGQKHGGWWRTDKMSKKTNVQKKKVKQNKCREKESQKRFRSQSKECLSEKMKQPSQDMPGIHLRPFSRLTVPATGGNFCDIRMCAVTQQFISHMCHDPTKYHGNVSRPNTLSSSPSPW